MQAGTIACLESVYACLTACAFLKNTDFWTEKYYVSFGEEDHPSVLQPKRSACQRCAEVRVLWSNQDIKMCT